MGQAAVDAADGDPDLAVEKRQQVGVDVDPEAEGRQRSDRVEGGGDLLALRRGSRRRFGVLERLPEAEDDQLRDRVVRHPVDEARGLAAEREAGSRRLCRVLDLERGAAAQAHPVGLGDERGAGRAEGRELLGGVGRLSQGRQIHERAREVIGRQPVHRCAEVLAVRQRLAAVLHVDDGLDACARLAEHQHLADERVGAAVGHLDLDALVGLRREAEPAARRELAERLLGRVPGP